MNHMMANPRSTLHALKPLGCGTPEVESLLSYFCRLAVSHSVSVSSLARTVANALEGELREDFDWHERNLSGTGESAQTWAGALSALTGVGHLDQLTLLAWRDVMAQRGLTARRGRWCPDCLADDVAQGGTPYFRLAWEVAEVNVCHQHRSPLVDVCPDCGRTGTRHKATYVVPGWCTHCGAFMGRRAGDDETSVTPEALWVARHVGLLLASHGMLGKPAIRTDMQEAIKTLVTRLDGGKATLFARRVGLSKTTVHHWLKDGGVPTLGNALCIAANVGLSLSKLLLGDLEGWEPPTVVNQLALGLGLDGQGKRDTPRELDWGHIKAELTRFASLPTPISVAEAARRLDVDDRHLYLRANTEARKLGERWKQRQTAQREGARARARPHLEQACRAILAEGRAISLREVEARVPREVLASVERLFDMLQDIKGELGVS